MKPKGVKDKNYAFIDDDGGDDDHETKLKKKGSLAYV